ncbi:restriction endonuclease subunit S [Serratia fonticola]|uniref:restriction endonuclease subunit S n=1 Tax=Serratia fonticola TaxID=47917 RepID=UPI0015C686B0|nr:restriction endonuclease subunit S [Serratia fonticola]MBC3379015.1 restriction endonuclease subunit S [Serratia fonticola]NYA38215.1 restriction endonuclease subunit S [Serratia fonticola]
MSRYQSYPEFKDSEVEWLGKIPKHWSAKPLKFLCTCNDQVISDTTDSDYELEYVDIGSVSSLQGIEKTENMTFSKSPSRAKRLVQDGDVIISTVRTYLEAIAPINNPPPNMVVSTGFAVIRPRASLDKGFASYCMRASGFIKEVVARSVGVSYPAINASDLISIPVPNCPFSEQSKIATFLDHETMKIDDLIEKQQQLIELLKEKRQAVISHAVTKGLNPDVPMKDSGVEWLGQVPEHWEVTPLKYLCDLLKDGTHLPPQRVDLGIPLLSVRNIINGRFLFRDDDSQISEASYLALCSSFTPKENDVLLAIVGATLGKVAIVTQMKKFHIQRSLAIFRTNREIINKLLAYIFESQRFQNLLWGNVGFSAQPGIYLGTLANFRLPVPPLNEQLEIVLFCTKKSEYLDSLIVKAQEAITLMQERRTALISAAVTGKIDVRNWVAPTNDTEVNQEPQEVTG